MTYLEIIEKIENRDWVLRAEFRNETEAAIARAMIVEALRAAQALNNLNNCKSNA